MMVSTGCSCTRGARVYQPHVGRPSTPAGAMEPTSSLRGSELQLAFKYPNIQITILPVVQACVATPGIHTITNSCYPRNDCSGACSACSVESRSQRILQLLQIRSHERCLLSLRLRLAPAFLFQSSGFRRLSLERIAP